MADTEKLPTLMITAYVKTVLRVMLDKPRSWHSAPDICEVCSLPPQTVRGVLTRLEAAGWIASEWEEPGLRSTPPRRLYAFAPGGKAAASRAI